MLQLGKTQTLTMLRETSAGAYLAESRDHAEEAVLLPGRQIPAGLKPGDTVEISFGSKTLRAEVLSVQEAVRKDDAAAMYREI